MQQVLPQKERSLKLPDKPSCTSTEQLVTGLEWDFPRVESMSAKEAVGLAMRHSVRRVSHSIRRTGIAVDYLLYDVRYCLVWLIAPLVDQ